MYNAQLIEDELLSVLGWKQQLDIGQPQLLELYTSESGLYFDDFHPLINLQTISAFIQEFDLMEFELYDAAKTYSKGYFVKSGTKFYRSLQDANLNNLITDAAWWVETNEFTHWVRTKTLSGINYALHRWLYEKFDRKTMRNLLEANILFPEGESIFAYTQRIDKAVGHVIRPMKSRNLTYQMKRFSLHLKDADTVTVKLFKAGQATPVKEQVVTYTTGGNIQWVTVTDWFLEPGRTYYIAYDESALAAGNQSINALADQDYIHDNRFEYYPTGMYFEAVGFSVESDLTSLWDTRQNIKTLSTNYGLNFDITVNCDYTNFIIENKMFFAPLFGYGVTIQMMQLQASNPYVRLDRGQKNAQVQASVAYLEREGSDEKPGGIRKEFDKALAMLSFDMSGLDNACLPCRKRGVSIKVFK